MSRRLRIGRYSEDGRLYLLTCVVLEREPIFRDLTLARSVIQQLRLVHQEGRAKSLAWVVMPDHLHWLVELNSECLDALMRNLKSRSALQINRLRQRQGRVWQRGFHDRALRKEDDVRKVARYIIANPLRAGLVEDVGDYPHWDAIWL